MGAVSFHLPVHFWRTQPPLGVVAGGGEDPVVLSCRASSQRVTESEKHFKEKLTVNIPGLPEYLLSPQRNPR